jgi:hypothetical protein
MSCFAEDVIQIRGAGPWVKGEHVLFKITSASTATPKSANAGRIAP